MLQLVFSCFILMLLFQQGCADISHNQDKMAVPVMLKKLRSVLQNMDNFKSEARKLQTVLLKNKQKLQPSITLPPFPDKVKDKMMTSSSLATGPLKQKSSKWTPPTYAPATLAQRNIYLAVSSYNVCASFCKPKIVKLSAKEKEKFFFINCSDITFLLSRSARVERVPVLDTPEYCCKVGGYVAAPDNKEDLLCLHRNLHNLTKGSFNNVLFWSAFYDFDMKRNFRRCYDRKVLPEGLWATNQPNNLDGLESNLALKLTGPVENIGYHDIDVTKLLAPVCQLSFKPASKRR